MSLNLVLLFHTAVAFAIGFWALIWPVGLARVGMIDVHAVLASGGVIYGKLFGMCLILIAAVAGGALVSSSAPARRLIVKAMMGHLLVGLLVSFTFPVTFTMLLSIAICALFLIAYAYLWLFRKHEF